MRLVSKRSRPTRTEKAANALLSAQAEASNIGRSSLVDMYQREYEQHLNPAEGSTEIVLGEAVPMPYQYTNDDDYNVSEAMALDHVIDTLTQPNPNAIHLDASAERTTILHNAGALEIGIDAAESIGAKNSLEKMLAHQMAVCHVKAMSMMTKAENFPRGREDLEIKMLNVAARMMDTFQKGMETLNKTRNGGKQTIVVKQVHVSGGQNVIADKITGRGGKHGRD